MLPLLPFTFTNRQTKYVYMLYQTPFFAAGITWIALFAISKKAS